MIMLATGLQSLGHSVKIIALDGPGGFDNEARLKGLEVAIVARRPLSSFRTTFHYLRHVRQYKPDFIYAFLPKQHLAVTLLRFFTRPAKIVWGIRASEVDWSSYRLRARLFFPATTFLSRWADLYIANSWAGSDYHIRQGYSAGKMHVIPNGVDAEVFRPDSHARHQKRRDWSISPACLIVGMLARFDPMKGNEDFLIVASKVTEEFPETRFVAMGRHSPEEATAYGRKVKALGLEEKLLLFNTTENPEHFLNAIDVLVVPSKTEGFPNTVIEALACGTRVVATNVGDIRKIIGEQNSLADYGDCDILAAGVIAMLRKPIQANERQEIADSVVNRFSIEQLVQSTVKLLNRI
jgi:glycosyltransferase involved in cell wall biosynthesis